MDEHGNKVEDADAVMDAYAETPGGTAQRTSHEETPGLTAGEDDPMWKGHAQMSESYQAMCSTPQILQGEPQDIWQWQHDNGKWYNMTEQHNAQFVARAALGHTDLFYNYTDLFFFVDEGICEYHVDLVAKTQVNTRTGKKRALRVWRVSP